MARVTTTGGIDHGGNAGFRAWVSEFISLLVSAGLVRTADTGQINEATVNRPNGGTAGNPNIAGYAIFRFADPLQATNPVYIKVGFGSGNLSQRPAITVSIGTGTDGAGQLTGLVTPAIAVNAESSGDTPGSGIEYVSRAIHHMDGFAAIAFKMGAFSGGIGFIVQRTVDNTGSPTGEGVVLIVSSTASSLYGQIAAFAYSDVLPRPAVNTSWLGQAHFGLTDSRVGLSPQAFHHWTALPKVKPLLGSISFLRGEFPLHAQASLAMVGATPRNYIGLGPHFGDVIRSQNRSDMAILWED